MLSKALAPPPDDDLSLGIIDATPLPTDWTHLGSNLCPWDEPTQRRHLQTIPEYPALGTVFKRIGGRWLISPARVCAFISLAESEPPTKRPDRVGVAS